MTTDTQGMSPEEIALTAELDGEGLPPEAASEAANREALQRPSDTDDDTDTDDGDAPAAPAAPVPAAPAPAAPASVEAITADDDTAEIAAPYEVDVPADADKQIKALADEKAIAFTSLMDGDMTAEAYRAIEERTNTGIKAIETKLITATVLQEANQQQAASEWKRAQAAEFTAFKGDGLDYQGKPSLLAAYNVNLKTLAAVPENENKSARWFLREAHRLTKADLGVTSARAAAPAPAPAARGVDRSQIPPTLARTPPAVDPTVAGDEFAHMGNLTGAAAERAYANMTPEQQERYLDA